MDKKHCGRCGGHSEFLIGGDPEATEAKQKEFDDSVKKTGLCPQCKADEHWLGWDKAGEATNLTAIPTPIARKNGLS